MVVRGDGAEITVELVERPVAQEMWKRLPMESKARLRGEEIHFLVLVPEAVEPPDRDGIQVGDVAYWPEENALCLFCGPATDESPRVAEDFTKVGRIIQGMDSCKRVRANETLRIEAAEG